MNDAVKPVVSDEMVEAACRAVVLGEDERGRSVYLTPNEARAAISAALAAQGQEAVDSDIIAAAKDICLVMDIDVSGRDISWRQSFESAIQNLRSALTAPAQPVGVLDEWLNDGPLTPEEAWTILCETPDITSPAEYPDHALITMEQLAGFMQRAAPQPPAEDGWETDYQIVTMQGEFCAEASSLEDAHHYAMVYSQDGPVQIMEIRRRPLPPAPANGGEQ